MKAQTIPQKQSVAITHRRTTIGGLLALAAAAAAPAAAWPPAAAARIQTERLLEQSAGPSTPYAAGFSPSSVPLARAPPPPRDAPAEPSGRGADASVRSAAADALGRLAAARRAAEDARWGDALDEYSGLVRAHPDLALATYGRLGRAIMLYQAGEVSKAVALLDELEVESRGLPEVHAALAAVLWAERPGQRLRAEQQFEIATEFDKRYADVSFVTEQRHWPPRLVAALERFLRLE